ncbi:MAG TPA: hypothetical protein PL093_01385 [Candidatus Pacearchaeota archaeon]|jgi:hypothetical protein|nr:hypothetical protein [Candidatus Pacearchaeota archaeon]HRR94810.1 hypothetical protein [Candidatus Paceibacterota bacterium]HPC30567.1 hypothetical protein [Candidatus Pacearchaeota archaeon]HQG09312.1 hypothetical protein [Candidatus Pacearchaeota archaeon]HQH20214.1 hypothetical protein [Candidatus Pacearchaeota archaeon]
MKITQKTILADIIEDQKAEAILEKYGVPCLTCPYAQEEMNSLTLGQICETYGLDGDALIDELNQVLNKESDE